MEHVDDHSYGEDVDDSLNETDQSIESELEAIKGW